MSEKENLIIDDEATVADENLQLAENDIVDQEQKETVANEYEEKRKLLEKTKIVKQTWSISEIYQKIKEKKLILDPDYQRRAIWQADKKTAFIESLYMEIMIPPIYVVEIPGEDILEENKYEVVDGKQRLTAIMDYIQGSLRLLDKNLEYYSDIFGNKSFSEIKEIASEKTSQMLSSVLDIYVITANSPEFTKYDIFARLNKGAEKLKVNEIRRAIYRSFVTLWISEYVEEKLQNNIKEYKSVFSANSIKHYEDYGRFYRSIAFYINSDTAANTVNGYNSRPREMINKVLQDFQKKSITIEKDTVQTLLDVTLKLRVELKDTPNADYLIDAIIPFSLDQNWNIFEKLNDIISNDKVQSTFEKSPATTSNVNLRLKYVSNILKGVSDE